MNDGHADERRQLAVEREATILAGTRSPRGALQSFVILGLFAALGAIRAVPRGLGVSFAAYQIVVLGMIVTSIPTTLAFRPKGPQSRLYRILVCFDASWYALGPLVLVYLSPSVISVFWLWFAGIILVNTIVDYRYIHLPLAIFGPLGLAAAYVHRGDVSSAAIAVIIGGTTAALYTVLQNARAELERTQIENVLLQREIERRERVGIQERIARDLHDGLGAELTALLWRARELAASSDEKEREDVLAITSGTAAALDELREIVVGMREAPSSIEELVPYVRARVTRICAGRATVEVVAEGGGPRVGPERLPHLVRGIMEAVRNAVQHAGARKIVVRLESDAASITDDGAGFAGVEAHGGEGLRNLRERAAALGGELEVRRTDRGTEIRLGIGA